MNLTQHLWRLISRKLAGEASPEELQELQFLLQNDPQLQPLMDTLEELWKPGGNQDGPQLEQAWQRHAKRLERTMRHAR